MNKPVIINGEASETDSEDDYASEKPSIMTKSVQGAVITGEDSESENENDTSISSAVSALHLPNQHVEENQNKYDSLLYEKLRDYNHKLHSDIDMFWQNATEDSSKTLGLVDHHLLRSQITIQNALSSLKSLGVTSATLKNKLQSMLSANFIPNVNVDNLDK